MKILSQAYDVSLGWINH